MTEDSLRGFQSSDVGLTAVNQTTLWRQLVVVIPGPAVTPPDTMNAITFALSAAIGVTAFVGKSNSAPAKFGAIQRPTLTCRRWLNMGKPQQVAIAMF